MDRDDLRLHVPESRGHGLGATGSSRNHRRVAGHLALGARGYGHDHRAHALGAGERLERPLEEWPPPEGYEGLRTAGSEAFAGAGGRNDR